MCYTCCQADLASVEDAACRQQTAHITWRHSVTFTFLGKFSSEPPHLLLTNRNAGRLPSVTRTLDNKTRVNLVLLPAFRIFFNLLFPLHYIYSQHKLRLSLEFRKYRTINRTRHPKETIFMNPHWLLSEYNAIINFKLKWTSYYYHWPICKPLYSRRIAERTLVRCAAARSHGIPLPPPSHRGRCRHRTSSPFLDWIYDQP